MNRLYSGIRPCFARALRRGEQVIFMAAVVIMLFCTNCSQKETTAPLPPGDADNGKLALPNGFEAVVVVDSIGKARHLAVNDNGDIYVKLRGVTPLGGSVALRDTTGDGKADIIKYFGTYKDSRSY